MYPVRFRDVDFLEFPAGIPTYERRNVSGRDYAALSYFTDVFLRLICEKDSEHISGDRSSIVWLQALMMLIGLSYYVARVAPSL